VPKPNRGKTETIKQRVIYVYLPSDRAAKDWKGRVGRAGTSNSKFVFDRVENSIRRA